MSASPVRMSLVAAIWTVAGAALVGVAHGQAIPQTMTGVPEMVKPLYPEVGAPSFTTPLGSETDLGTSDGGIGPSTGGNGGNSMLSTPWGPGAATLSESIGVNASTLAAMCAVESGCDSSSRNGSFVGAFQMGPAAFSDGLKTALAANPALASQIVSGPGGINDPTTNAIAAAGYMLKGANALQAAGVASPTYSQVRGYFQFGPGDGINVAKASGDATLGATLRYTSAATLAANGLTSSMTVSQYQASFAQKAGSAASLVVKASPGG